MRILKIFFLIVCFYELKSQTISNINGYLIIEKFSYTDRYLGDVGFGDSGDFNTFFFKILKMP